MAVGGNGVGVSVGVGWRVTWGDATRDVEEVGVTDRAGATVVRSVGAAGVDGCAGGVIVSTGASVSPGVAVLHAASTTTPAINAGRELPSLPIGLLSHARRTAGWRVSPQCQGQGQLREPGTWGKQGAAYNQGQALPRYWMESADTLRHPLEHLSRHGPPWPTPTGRGRRAWRNSRAPILLSLTCTLRNYQCLTALGPDRSGPKKFPRSQARANRASLTWFATNLWQDSRVQFRACLPGCSWQKPYPTQEREMSDRSRRVGTKSEIDKDQRPIVSSGDLIRTLQSA